MAISGGSHSSYSRFAFRSAAPSRTPHIHPYPAPAPGNGLHSPEFPGARIFSFGRFVPSSPGLLRETHQDVFDVLHRARERPFVLCEHQKTDVMSSSAELVELDLHRQETEKEAQTDIQLRTSGHETQDVQEELQREQTQDDFHASRPRKSLLNDTR